MGTRMSRTGLLRRGAVGTGALLVSSSGLSAFAGVASAATLPDADLAYLRLLIAAELLAVDFQTHALASGKLRRAAASLAHRIRADENAHYAALSNLMVGAGQTPATADDIDFAYPKGSFRSQSSIVKLARRLEHLMVGAYVGANASVEAPELRLLIGQVATNEARHAGALAALAGRPTVGEPFAPPLPIAAVSRALDEFES